MLLQDEKVHFHIAQSEKYEWELARMHGVAFRNEKVIEDLRKQLAERATDLKTANEEKATALQNLADLNDDLMKKIRLEGSLRLEVQ